MPESRLAAEQVLSVERAGADLRRGLAVAIAAPDGAAGPAGALAVAAELATADSLARLAGLAQAPLALVLTAERAAALAIRPNGQTTVRVPLTPWMTAEALRGIADPTSDLAHPLRGPFPRELQAPNRADAAAPFLCKHAQLLPA